MKRIAHLTSVHSRGDTRIFLKMCRSLSEAGYDVTLVVADGKGNTAQGQVEFLDVGTSRGRFDRIRNAPGRVFKKALELDADIYHLHDPELIPIGLRLKRLKKRVIFDAHEDVPKQLLSKPYLNKSALWILSKTFGAYESWACRYFDGVIGATPVIRDKFLSINSNTVNISNFPLADELANKVCWSDKRPEICYVGGIGRIRGIQEVCAAMGLLQTDARLNLCGAFSEKSVEQQVRLMPGWQRVTPLGFVDRDRVRAVLARSVAALVTFHPVSNHVDAQPNKMFEYMSAGIPVIASDFPLWREIIAGSDCGLLVDPLKPQEIAKAIDTLVSNPEMAQRMGENGRKAVEERFNWQIEEQKLLTFYDSLLSCEVL